MLYGLKKIINLLVQNHVNKVLKTMKKFKSITYDLCDLKNESPMPTILYLWNEGIKAIIVNDSENKVVYKIILSDLNIYRVQGVCFLNDEWIIEGDFEDVYKGNDKSLLSVIDVMTP